MSEGDLKKTEDQLKLLLKGQGSAPGSSLTLKKVLKKAQRKTAQKDLLMLFFGWFWVVLVGFGAVVYKNNISAKKRAVNAPTS